MIEPRTPPETTESLTPEPIGSERTAGAPAAARPSADDRPIVRLSVSRRKQADRKPHFEDFELPVDRDGTVLDALLEVRRTLDPSLVIRHACMRGSCGACGVRVDGRESLACVTPLKPAGARTIKVEPLSGQRPIADLAVDMVDFQSRMAEVELPRLRAAELANGAVPPESIRTFARFENCIECGLCLSACPVTGSDPRYIGPAALAAAARIVDEPRGRDVGPVLALAREPDSVWRGRDVLECSAVCPAAVEPGMAVIALRRRIAGDRLGRLFGRGRD
jgi:succinate dehydrogenase / fumarate reductase iron-sulfur subunit